MTKKINELYEWFWEYGIKRADEHQISGEWITDLYTVKFFNEQIDRNLKINKKNIGLWGPSQAGKSTFLSKVIDCDNGQTSALMWDNKPFLFNGQIRSKIPALNPYNLGSDGTACVTKYFMPEDTENINKNYPVEIKLLSLSDLLLMLTVGYSGRFNDSNNSWQVDEFEEFLKTHNDDNSINNNLDRDATELIVNLIFTIDKLIKMNDYSFINLTRENNWKNRFRDKILLNRNLCSNIDVAKDFIKNILWKNTKDDSQNSNEMHNIFDSLTKNYYKYNNMLNNKKLICDLNFVSYIIDMGAAKSKIDDGNILQTPRVASLIDNINYKLVDNTIVICSDGDKIFIENIDEFITFQILIKEVAIPLNKDLLDKKVLEENTEEKISDFFSNYTILDFPGLTNFGKTDGKIELLAVAKYGKALTAIYPYAESLELTSLLLTLPVAQPIGQANTIKMGIDYINNPTQYFFESKDIDVSIPVNINYTFFIKALSDYLIKKEQPDSLDGYDTNLDLGNLLDNTVSFATNYHWFDRGNNINISNLTSDEEYSKFIKKFMDSNWIKRRFKSKDEKECLRLLVNKILTNPDGGVYCLLGLISYHLDTLDIKKRYENFEDALMKKFKELITKVLPVNGVNAQKIDQTTDLFIIGLNSKLNSFENTRKTLSSIGDVIDEDTENNSISDEERIENFEEEVTEFYKNILNLLICKQTIFDNDSVSILPYYRMKIQYFMNDADKFKILQECNLDHSESSIILAVLKEKFPDNQNIQNFISETFGSLSEVNANQDRYISQYISNCIYKPKSLYDKNRLKHCQKIFIKNQSFPKISLVNILLDYKIKEIINEIKEIIKGVQNINREHLNGDHELLKIQESII